MAKSARGVDAKLARMRGLRTEPITPQLILAGVLMAFGVWLHLTERHAHEHTHEAIEHEHMHTHDDLHHDHAHAETPRGPHSHVHRHEAITHEHEHGDDRHHRHRHCFGAPPLRVATENRWLVSGNRRSRRP